MASQKIKIMIKKIAQIGFFLAITAFMFSFTLAPEASTTEDPVKWYTWEEAVEAQKTAPKKMMVDVYTTWCGPCKMMSNSTFKDPKVAAYLNEHFYPVKLNAEMKEDIVYDGNTFTFRADAGRRGLHTLAYALLDGQMRYPSIVFMDENMQRITISPGFKKANDFMTELEYCADGHYANTKFDDFVAKKKSGAGVPKP